MTDNKCLKINSQMSDDGMSLQNMKAKLQAENFIPRKKKCPLNIKVK